MMLVLFVMLGLVDICPELLATERDASNALKVSENLSMRSSENPSSNLIYFYDESCPECEKFSSEYLPKLKKRYGNSLSITTFNLSSQSNYELLMQFEKEYKISPQEAPILFTASGMASRGENIFSDVIKIIDMDLNGLQNEHRSFIQSISSGAASSLQLIDLTTTCNDNRELAKSPLTPVVIHICLKPGCAECDRLSREIRYCIEKSGSKINVINHNINDNQDRIFNEALCDAYNIPESFRLTAPAFFAGKTAAAGEVKIKQLPPLHEIINNEISAGNSTIQISDSARASAEKRIMMRYSAIKTFSVLAAGLLDGVNPCAFATIIFLVSYLAVRKYRRFEILAVGASFSLAVFLTYFLSGLGVLSLLSEIAHLSWTKNLVKYSGISLSLIVAVVNLTDFIILCKSNNSLNSMSSKLPEKLRTKINSLIREHVRLHHYAAGAFVMGVGVSLLELACTGQVYLPTLLFMVSSGATSLRLYIMLALYNFAFILPLLAVFALVLWGIGDKALSNWLTSNAALIKLSTAILFIAMAVFLVFMI